MIDVLTNPSPPYGISDYLRVSQDSQLLIPRTEGLEPNYDWANHTVTNQFSDGKDRYIIGSDIFPKRSRNFLHKITMHPWGFVKTEIQSPTPETHLFHLSHTFSTMRYPNKDLLRCKTLTPLLDDSLYKTQFHLAVGPQSWLGTIQTINQKRWLELRSKIGSSAQLMILNGDPIVFPLIGFSISIQFETLAGTQILVACDDNPPISLPFYDEHPNPQAGSLAEYYLGNDRPYEYNPKEVYDQITSGWETEFTNLRI